MTGGRFLPPQLREAAGAHHPLTAFNPEEARRQLADAGSPGGPPTGQHFRT